MGPPKPPSSLQSNTPGAPPPALRVGLRAINDIAHLANVPYAREILGVAKVITEAIAEGVQTSEDLQRLSARVTEIAMTCANAIVDATGSTGIGKRPDIVLFVDQLLRSMENLAAAVSKHMARGKFRHVFTRSRDIVTIKQYEEELEYAVGVFSLRMQLTNVTLSSRADGGQELKSEVEMKIAEAHAEQLSLIKAKVKEQSFSSTRSLGRVPKQDIPSAPLIFFGRSPLLTQTVQLLTSPSQSFVAILGSGGIGKTSLALSVLHQPEIKQVYGSYRYFVPCDATLDSEGLISKISDLFNLPEEAPLAHLKTISKYAEGRILIFLDNLETPWEPAESRKGVESVLAQLADIENVSLLVTLRGAERPYGIPWTRPTLKPLEPLDINAAIETFLAISDGNAQDDHLVPLLNAIDCVPLAVTLMASQAQYATCKDLLDRWHAQKTKMLTRGYEGKGSSLDVSISLSVQSERLQRNRQAVALLQVLSLLPDGSTVGSLESMMPAFMDLNTGSPLASPLGSPLSPSTGPGGMHSLAHSMSSLSLASQSSIGTAKTYSSTQAPQSQTKMDIPTALMTLQQVALASVSQTGLIQTLSPVREHVKAHLPMSLELFRAVFGYHRSLTKLAKETAYSYKMPEMIVVVATQIANIHGVILKGLDEIGGVMVEGEEMSPLSPFGSDSGSLSPSTTSTAAMTTAESVLALRKEAIEACCEISYFHSSTTEGSIMSLLRVALSRGVEIGDKRLEARTLDRMSAWEENDRGWELQKRAEKLFLELGESANEDLGQLYTQMVKNRRSSSEYDTATELAKKSVKLLEGSSNVLARARSLAALSDIMLLDSHVPECMEAAYKGLALIREEEYPGLAFSFYRELTRAMVYRSLFTKAVECGYRALQLLGNTSMYESAYSYNDLGDALYIQSRLTEAGQLFQKAYDIFAAFEQTKKLETEQMSLGAVALAQYDFSKATTHFCLALEGSIQGNRRANQALVVGLLGSVELFQGRLHTANAHYAECMRRFVLLKFGGSIHTCAYLMPWGDTLLRAGAIEDARTCYISSLVICRSNASLLGSAQSIMRIGDMFYATAVDEEGLKTAKSCYEVTFELIKYLGVNRHLAECLYRRSMIAWREADGDKAIQMLKLALTFFERGEDPRGLEYARIAWQQVSSGQQWTGERILPVATVIMYQ